MKKIIALFALLAPAFTLPFTDIAEIMNHNIGLDCNNNKKISLEIPTLHIKYAKSEELSKIATVLHSYKDKLTMQLQTPPTKAQSILKKCFDYSSATLNTIKYISLASIVPSILRFGSLLPRDADYAAITFAPSISGEITIAELNRMVQAKKDELLIETMPSRRPALTALTIAAATALCSATGKFIVDYIGSKVNAAMINREIMQENCTILDVLLALIAERQASI